MSLTLMHEESNSMAAIPLVFVQEYVQPNGRDWERDRLGTPADGRAHRRHLRSHPKDARSPGKATRTSSPSKRHFQLGTKARDFVTSNVLLVIKR